jgi:cell wall assembly regulator SMI1
MRKLMSCGRQEREAEYMVLSTTEMVMWLDAHDGQVALSWMHGRKGENLHVESIASENGELLVWKTG